MDPLLFYDPMNPVLDYSTPEEISTTSSSVDASMDLRWLNWQPFDLGNMITVQDQQAVANQLKKKRGRGRPAGSKNKKNHY